MRLSELIRRIGSNAGILPATGGQDARVTDPDVKRVCEDSRKVEAGDLFVARSGTKTSGAKFAAEAIAKGAVAVVSEESPGMAIPGLDRIAWVQVGDANLAAALLAHEVAGRPTAGMKMIAVTGTKGKTTVAYLMRSVLKGAGSKVGMIGTVEIDDGKSVTPAEMTTPGSVELVDWFCRMRDNGVTHCVMEVSSHALHQHRTAGIDFAVAIFTNLTGDHLDYHKTMEEYAAAKAILFEGLKEGAVAVVNADDKWAERMVSRCKAKVLTYRVATKPKSGSTGMVEHSGANLIGYISQMSSNGMGMTISWANSEQYGITATLVGKHNCYNILGAAMASEVLGLELNHMRITRILRDATGAPGRLQAVMLPGKTREEMPFQVFVDYAHTHDALENVLRALRATMGSTGNPSRDRQGATHWDRATKPVAS